MSEDQIERIVSARTDRLDARLMRGEVSQADYDRLSAEITAWAEARYRTAR